jgi:hypothetical protein
MSSYETKHVRKYRLKGIPTKHIQSSGHNTNTWIEVEDGKTFLYVDYYRQKSQKPKKWKH